MIRILLTLSLSAVTCLLPTTEGAAESSFVFGAAGDFSANPRTTGSTLASLASSGTSFFLALGDLSYSPKTPEREWTNYVQSSVGSTYPFELVAGNHEDDEGKDGFILNFAAGLPNRIGAIVGSYAVEYYFDYPTSRPLSRVILISPGLKIKGTNYEYTQGSFSYRWVADAIDEARQKEIPWVIVGMHKVCISATARHGCEIGPELLNLLIAKKVDVVLQGHEHSYERSKQLTCAALDSFQPTCVVNDGSTGQYTKGAGTIIVIAGTGGQKLDSPHRLQLAPYFASVMDNTTPGYGWGFVKYAVSRERIDAETIFSGSFQDMFHIIQRSNQ